MKPRLTKDLAIEKARRIHGDKYKYPEDYINYRAKMRIICPKHGEFFQEPRVHIDQGSGCPTCGIRKRAESRTKTHAQFLEVARIVHGERYIYPDPYINMHMKLRIICREHGEFFQTPTAHIHGKQGCPACGIRKRAERP